MAAYYCHACDRRFDGPTREYGTYKFQYCPYCGSAKTTLTHQS
jgi:rRNA maturation endonuclease Nob1